jgi:hypothetical protein
MESKYLFHLKDMITSENEIDDKIILNKEIIR